jgi:hypothetical protein
MVYNAHILGPLLSTQKLSRFKRIAISLSLHKAPVTTEAFITITSVPR